MNDVLSIIIPTHNRKELLLQAIASVKHIFGDNIKIIVGDNSSYDYEDLNDINCIHNVHVLNLRKYEANLPFVYQKMISYAHSSYVLPLDDDDLLDNSCLHLKILSMLKNKKHICMSFNTKLYDEKPLLDIKNMHIVNDINKVPELWNGNFQTGAMYYYADDLMHAINIFSNIATAFDLSHDECWAMYCISKSQYTCHFPSIGLIVRRHQSMSSSKGLSLFSSRSYISNVCTHLDINANIQKLWEKIQLRELNDICQFKVNHDDVFGNKVLLNIEKTISNMIINGKSYKYAKSQLLKNVDAYANELKSKKHAN